MMALTTYQAFEQFMDDITITDYQKTSIVEARRHTVIENLTAAFPKTSDLPFYEGRLIGSASKGTIVRPLDDIDVLAIFSNENGAWGKYSWDSQAFLYRIRRAYAASRQLQSAREGKQFGFSSKRVDMLMSPPCL
jgi:Second Messenger Oligonucleotide or Dinucleotide Synthetase domain